MARIRKDKQADQQNTARTQNEGSENATTGQLPIIASARTGLAGSDDALMRRLPVSYEGKTVRDVLSYMVDSEVKTAEAPIAASLKKELGSAGSVVVINGQNARLTDPVSQYMVEGTHDVGGKQMQYQQLEIEVSAVQQGGFRAPGLRDLR